MPTDLHPDFPVVSGDYPLTANWRVDLPQQFNRRIEDGSLVLWRPELTLWINVWNNDQGASVDGLLASVRDHAHPERRDERIERSGTHARLSYELSEEDMEEPGATQESLNGFVIAASGYVQISAYYESPAAHALARQILGSVVPAA